MVSVGSPPARMHSQPDGPRPTVKHSIYYIVMAYCFNGLKGTFHITDRYNLC